MQYLFQESSASLEVQGSSKLKIQINEPRFKKGEVFFYCIPIIIAAGLFRSSRSPHPFAPCVRRTLALYCSLLFRDTCF